MDLSLKLICLSLCRNQKDIISRLKSHIYSLGLSKHIIDGCYCYYCYYYYYTTVSCGMWVGILHSTEYYNIPNWNRNVRFYFSTELPLRLQYTLCTIRKFSGFILTFFSFHSRAQFICWHVHPPQLTHLHTHARLQIQQHLFILYIFILQYIRIQPCMRQYKINISTSHLMA